MRVLKIGGNELDDPGFLPLLARWVAGVTAVGEQIIVVHGGGLDELTTTGTSEVIELRDGRISHFEVDAQQSDDQTLVAFGVTAE